MTPEKSKKASLEMREANRTQRLSEKGEKIRNIIDENDFGCGKDPVRKLMSVLMGEEITKNNGTLTPVKNAVVRIGGYGLCLITRTTSGSNILGSAGNTHHFSKLNKEDVCIATDEEVDKFYTLLEAGESEDDDFDEEEEEDDDF